MASSRGNYHQDTFTEVEWTWSPVNDTQWHKSRLVMLPDPTHMANPFDVRLQWHSIKFILIKIQIILSSTLFYYLKCFILDQMKQTHSRLDTRTGLRQRVLHAFTCERTYLSDLTSTYITSTSLVCHSQFSITHFYLNAMQLYPYTVAWGV